MIIKRIYVTAFALIVLAGASLSLIVGCEEKEVPFVVDADEIMRYLGQDPSARELLRVDGLINPTPYTLPFDSATIRDSLLSRSRDIEIMLVPLKIPGPGGDSIANDPDRIYVDHGYLGRVRECLVRITDAFEIEVKRTYTQSVRYDTTELRVNRYAFFLKLGNDNRDYVGWVLWGFNGAGSTAPPLGITIKADNGAEFRGDFGLYDSLPKSDFPRVPFRLLSRLDTVTAGSQIEVSTEWAANQGTPTYQVLSDFGAGGALARACHRYDTLNYADSASYQTPDPNPRFYNLMLIQAISPISYPSRTGFMVPYRR